MACNSELTFENMILRTVFVVTLVTLLTSISEARQTQQRAVHRAGRMDVFDNCPDRPLRPYRLLKGKISLIGKHLYVFNGEGINEKATKKLELAVVNVTKCADRTRSKCEHFQHLEWKPSSMICVTLTMPMTPWRSIVNSFHPALNCVNPKGPWTLKNMTLDFKEISGLKLFGNEYYLVQWEFFDDKLSPWSCFDMAADFPIVRE